MSRGSPLPARMFTVILALAAGPAAAQQAIVNIRGQVSGYYPATGFTAPVKVRLPAGTYQLTDGAGFSGADYVAFNKHLNAYEDWFWDFVVGDASTGSVLATAGSLNAYTSVRKAALGGLRSQPVMLTLAAPTTLDFAVYDNYVPDNTGGISVRIVACHTGGCRR